MFFLSSISGMLPFALALLLTFVVGFQTNPRVASETSSPDQHITFDGISVDQSSSYYTVSSIFAAEIPAVKHEIIPEFPDCTIIYYPPGSCNIIDVLLDSSSLRAPPVSVS